MPAPIIAGLFAQGRNIVRPRFYAMLADLMRFYRQAPRDLGRLGATTLADYLAAGRYGAAFRDDHFYPMAAAIWSTPAADIGAIRRGLHPLLRQSRAPAPARPAVWRTVRGGKPATTSPKLAAPLAGHTIIGRPVRIVERTKGSIMVHDGIAPRRFDRVLVACHADQRALGPSEDPTDAERRVLGAFRYCPQRGGAARRCRSDAGRRRRLERGRVDTSPTAPTRPALVTYWMKRHSSTSIRACPCSSP